ncbi:hypothetical protein Scep_004201 [Stephania cephalantha]|uniref:Uncharacterized protein n=1 Tax=Stephania cephalantha TaxID=152367 RepID=A0AAP0PV51_9MAGN
MEGSRMDGAAGVDNRQRRCSSRRTTQAVRTDRRDSEPDFKDSIAIEHPGVTVAPFGMFSRAKAQVSR